MESDSYSQFPIEASTVHVALFQDVQNAATLRTRLVAAASMTGPEGEAEREALNFAFIDARLICSPLHLRTAVYHALLAYTQRSLRTKTVHSEIIWALNPSNNITEALRRYGLSNDTTSLLVVRVSQPSDSYHDQIAAAVKGTLVPLDRLSGITDWTAVKKYYKLNGEACVRNASGDEHAKINNIVTSSVATKTILS